METVPSPGKLPSLLLARTNYNLAGFGLPDGNWREDYEPLYERFNLICSDRGRQLDELDVNFVYCVPQPGEEFDRFCSAVETDVYFCRKFVVPLIDNIDSALARLPFLPLEKVCGASIRPDPAQVFLRVTIFHLCWPATSSCRAIVARTRLSTTASTGRSARPFLVPVSLPQWSRNLNEAPRRPGSNQLKLRIFVLREKQVFGLAKIKRVKPLLL